MMGDRRSQAFIDVTLSIILRTCLQFNITEEEEGALNRSGLFAVVGVHVPRCP